MEKQKEGSVVVINPTSIKGAESEIASLEEEKEMLKLSLDESQVQVDEGIARNTKEYRKMRLATRSKITRISHKQSKLRIWIVSQTPEGQSELASIRRLRQQEHQLRQREHERKVEEARQIKVRISEELSKSIPLNASPATIEVALEEREALIAKLEINSQEMQRLSESQAAKLAPTRTELIAEREHIDARIHILKQYIKRKRARIKETLRVGGSDITFSRDVCIALDELLLEIDGKNQRFISRKPSRLAIWNVLRFKLQMTPIPPRD